MWQLDLRLRRAGPVAVRHDASGVQVTADRADSGGADADDPTAKLPSFRDREPFYHRLASSKRGKPIASSRSYQSLNVVSDKDCATKPLHPLACHNPPTGQAPALSPGRGSPHLKSRASSPIPAALPAYAAPHGHHQHSLSSLPVRLAGPHGAGPGVETERRVIGAADHAAVQGQTRGNRVIAGHVFGRVANGSRAAGTTYGSRTKQRREACRRRPRDRVRTPEP